MNLNSIPGNSSIIPGNSSIIPGNSSISGDCEATIVKYYTSCSSEVDALKNLTTQIPQEIKDCQKNNSCSSWQSKSLLEIACPATKKLGDCLKPAMPCITEGMDKNATDSFAALWKKCDVFIGSSTSTATIGGKTSTETASTDGETSTEPSYPATVTSTIKAPNTVKSETSTGYDATTSSDEETSTETATSDGETSTEILSSDGETSTIKTQTFTETVTSFDATSTASDTGETITITGEGFSVKTSLISLLAIALLW